MDYQRKYEQLLKEKEKVELEFGLARRRFKELYVGCENELNNEKETSRQLEIQVKEFARQNEQLKTENEGVRIAAKISEEAKEEEYHTLHMKHQEEVASLQHIWKEASNDRQNSLVQEFEAEHNKLLEANSKLEQKILQMSDEVGPKGNNDGLVSMMTNAFTSKKSPNVKGIDGPMSLTLENTQQQAQHDIDAWKSVLHPLEREVENLRSQLAEANKQINSQHAKDFAMTNKKLSDTEFLLNEELKEAQKYFESEKSARTDLEMYVAVLNTQKTVLQEDSDKLKRELHNVCRLFEQEKMNHNELKQTWKLANEQFLQQQQNMFYEFERTRNLLTTEQLEQLSINNPSHVSNTIKTVAEHPYQVTSTPEIPANKVNTSDKVNTSYNLIDFDSTDFFEPVKPLPNTNKKIPKGTTNNNDRGEKISDAIFSTFFPAAYHAKQFNEMLMDDPNVKEGPLILSSSSDSEDDDLVQAIHVQNMNRYGVEEGVEVQEISKYVTNAMTNPVAILEDFDNENILTKSTSTDNILNQGMTEPAKLHHEKSLSQGDVSTSVVELKSESHFDTQITPTDSIWKNISLGYAHTCMMCQNYEKQLQRLQKDYMALKEWERKLLDNVTSLQFQLDSSKENYCILEKSVENIASESRSQLCIYEKNQQEVDKQVMLLHTQFEDFQNGCLQEMKLLSAER